MKTNPCLGPYSSIASSRARFTALKDVSTANVVKAFRMRVELFGKEVTNISLRGRGCDGEDEELGENAPVKATRYSSEIIFGETKCFPRWRRAG